MLCVLHLYKTTKQEKEFERERKKKTAAYIGYLLKKAAKRN